MAVTLSIPITDEEQALIVELASKTAPGMTPLELKAWCERQAKRMLRQYILNIQTQQTRTEILALRQNKEAIFNDVWPDQPQNATPST